jgi:hypothetical protein
MKSETSHQSNENFALQNHFSFFRSPVKGSKKIYNDRSGRFTAMIFWRPGTLVRFHYFKNFYHPLKKTVRSQENAGTVPIFTGAKIVRRIIVETLPCRIPPGRWWTPTIHVGDSAVLQNLHLLHAGVVGPILPQLYSAFLFTRALL